MTKPYEHSPTKPGHTVLLYSVKPLALHSRDLSCCWSRSIVNLYPAVFPKLRPDCNTRGCQETYHQLFAMVATTAKRQCPSACHKTEKPHMPHSTLSTAPETDTYISAYKHICFSHMHWCTKEVLLPKLGMGCSLVVPHAGVYMLP